MILPKEIFWALLLLICGYAFWRGRTEERTAAAVCLAATIATHFLIPPTSARFHRLELGLLGIDIFVLLAFLAIALNSLRFWPLWAAGFQLTVSMSHLMKAVDVDLFPRAYAAAAVFWSYPILLVIFVGTLRAHRARAPAPA
jgi:hypothetical protein